MNRLYVTLTPPTHRPGPAHTTHTAASETPDPPGYRQAPPPSHTLTDEEDVWFGLPDDDDFSYPLTLVPLDQASPPSSDDTGTRSQPQSTRPAVLRYLEPLFVKTRCDAHLRLKACLTIEEALLHILMATNTGKKRKAGEHELLRLRVSAVVGLLDRYTPGSELAGIYAFMCLLNMRETRADNTPGHYMKLARALPDAVPVELRPYRQALIDQARSAIENIRTIDAQYFSPEAQAKLLAALQFIEVKLKAYEEEAYAPPVPVVSFANLQAKAHTVYARPANPASARTLARTHEHLVLETQTDAPPGPSSTPANTPFPHGGPAVPTGPVRPPPWGPAAYATTLLSLAQSQVLPLPPSVTRTCEAFARCPGEPQFSQVVDSISAEGFLGMLDLMRQLNPPMAGEVALYTALHYILRGLAMPARVELAVLDALPLLTAWPEDVFLSDTLTNRLNQQSPKVRQAVYALLNRRLRGRS